MLRLVAACIICISGCIRNQAVPCRSDEDCGATGAICDPSTLLCRRPSHVIQDASADLSPAPGDLLRECTTNDECSSTTPRCDTSAGRCTACRPLMESIDCPSPLRPRCDGTGACRGCRAHVECPSSLVCNRDGSCADPVLVVYASKGASCVDTGGGTRMTPFCEIQQAIDGRGARTIVRVMGSDIAYKAISITSGDLRIVGPGRAAMPTAQIAGFATHSVSVKGAATVVELDGLDVNSATMSNDGVNCDTGATLTVRSSRIRKNDRTGIRSVGCRLTVDAVLIDDTLYGGIYVENAMYSITNSIIRGNGIAGGGAPAVYLGSATSGVFRHNTIYKNGSGGTIVGGVQCIVSAMLESSIIRENSKSPSQVSPTTCVPSYVNIDEPGQVAPNRNIAPSFTGELRLEGPTPNNLSCCVDQILMSPVETDYDGTGRPVNGRWDIGAHELR